MNDIPTWAIVLWALHITWILREMKGQFSMILRELRNRD